MLQAHQRLHPCHTSAVETELRLVVRSLFACGDGMLQLSLELQPPADLLL
jgi:hypothetical protein